MIILAKGRYRAVEVRDDAALGRALALRSAAFPADRGGGDAYDGACRHVLVEDAVTAEAVATFRLMSLSHGGEVGQSYSAAVYDLSLLSRITGPMVELGRFCLRPGHRDPDILRLAWAALTRIVDEAGAEMLFGCASFPGTDWRAHAEVFALLRARHLAPPRWRPGVKAPRTVPLARGMGQAGEPRRALATMPPLLRSYLAMGGRVSDHAVIDAEMATLHVFTGIEVAAIPPARRRLLRATAE